MFSTTLTSSWDERSRRGFTTLTSFGLQALAVSILLVVPLLRPTGLPLFRPLSAPVSLGQPLEALSAAPSRTGSNAAALGGHANEILLRLPVPTSRGFHPTGDDGPPTVSLGPYIPGAPGSGDLRGLPDGLGPGTRPEMPVAPVPPAARLRISRMSEGDLIRKVLPTYPHLALVGRIEGTVLLQAVISKQGTIENLKAVSGHPMLIPAAIDAVRQWRYRPYLLNSEPVEVETQITVTFSLAGK